jgi:Tol biopolymer transport system component
VTDDGSSMGERETPPDAAGPRPAPAPPGLDDTPLAGGAPVSPDARWWSDVEGRHRGLRTAAIVALVCVLALAAGAAVTLLGPRLAGNGGAPAVPASSSSTAATSSSATSPSAPGAASSGATSSASGATSSVTATGAEVPVKRAAVVPFRRDGALWVCSESGADARRIVASADGPFALSPDGSTLAVVDAASKTLWLVDAATRAVVVVGTAELDPPSWAGDSSFVVYAALVPGGHDTVVRRVSRDGSARATLGAGAMPRVAPGGSVVAVSGSVSATGVPVVVFAGSTTRRIGSRIVANAVCGSASLVAYCDAGSPGLQASPRSPSIGVLRFDGTGQRTLVKRPAAGGAAFFGEVDVSPDGSRLVYAETGDDGYSRIFAMPVAGGRPSQLSTRRDAYVVGFSADGTELLYVDGNAVQGESTRLMAVHLDGSHRRVVLDDAGR